jgi:hypothetical protein
MPEQVEMYLNRVTITVLDDFYNMLKQAADEQSASIEAFVIDPVRHKLGLDPSPRLPVDTLRLLLVQELQLYAKDGLNSKGFLLQSSDKSFFAVLHVAHVKDESFTHTGLVTRIIEDFIVIERDVNDIPLVDALLQAGIPRRQIILAYAGEPVPETW